MVRRPMVAVGILIVTTSVVSVPLVGIANTGSSEIDTAIASAPAVVDASALDGFMADNGDLVEGATVDPAMSLKADAYMATDPHLKRIFGDRVLTVRRQGPWTTQRSRVTLGVVREVSVASALSVPTTLWPSMRWDETADFYVQHFVNQKVTQASVFTIFIDAKVGVIGFAPDNGTETDGGGNPVLDTESTH